MGTSRGNWFAIVRERFSRPSPRETIIVLHTDNTITANYSEEDATTREEDLNTQIIQLGNPIAVSSSSTQKEFLSEDYIAAIKIQAHFRGHLARRAFRARKALVKLQAIVRGVCVRRQARIALHCMHALARLQVNVRGRQLLSRCSHD